MPMPMIQRVRLKRLVITTKLEELRREFRELLIKLQERQCELSGHDTQWWRGWNGSPCSCTSTFVQRSIENLVKIKWSTITVCQVTLLHYASISSHLFLRPQSISNGEGGWKWIHCDDIPCRCLVIEIKSNRSTDGNASHWQDVHSLYLGKSCFLLDWTTWRFAARAISGNLWKSSKWSARSKITWSYTTHTTPSQLLTTNSTVIHLDPNDQWKHTTGIWWSQSRTEPTDLSFGPSVAQFLTLFICIAIDR